MKRFYLLFGLSISLLPISARADQAENSSAWSHIKDTVSQTWDANDYELFIPINTWHNRNYYTSEKIDSYNENPWGLGIGKYRFDNEGDWHSLYVIAFADSHNDIEPVTGYSFQKMWRPGNDLRIGAGYTVGLTMRNDMDYLPIPIAAPIASIEYKQLALQSAYIFGGEGNGNILFTWLRWQLK